MIFMGFIGMMMISVLIHHANYDEKLGIENIPLGIIS